MSSPVHSREPIPPQIRLAAVRAQIEETLELSKSTTAGRKQATLKKLMTIANDPATLSDERYAVLSIVLPWAVEVSDCVTFRGAIQLLTDRYEVDAIEERSKQWLVFLNNCKSVLVLDDALKDVVTTAMMASAKNRFVEAGQLLDSAEKEAQRITKKIFPSITETRTAIKDREQAYKEQKKSATILEQSPDDARANFLVGLWEVVFEDQWPDGLPKLAKGSDSDWKSAAEAELAPVGDIASRVAVADAWWKVAESSQGTPKQAAQRRALEKYSVLDANQLSPLIKTKVAKRKTDLAKVVKTVATTPSAPPPSTTESGPGSSTAISGPLAKVPLTADGNSPYFQRLRVHDRMTSAAISPRGNVLATSGDDSILALWNPFTGKPLAKIDLMAILSRKTTASCLEFTPDGKWVLAGFRNELCVFSAINLQLFRTIRCRCSNICVSENGRYLMTYDYDTDVELWNAQTWEREKSFNTNLHFVRHLAFTRDGMGAIASGGMYSNRPAPMDFNVVAWDWKTQKERFKLSTAPKIPNQLAEELSNGLLLIQGGDSAVALWNSKTLEREAHLRVSSATVYDTVATSDFSHILLLEGSQEYLNVVVCEVLENSLSLKTRIPTKMGIGSKIALTPDQRHVLVSSQMGWVEFLSLPEESVPPAARKQLSRPAPREIIPPLPQIKPVRVLSEAKSNISTIAFVSNSRLLSGGADRTLRLWDVDTGKLLKQTEFPEKQVINAIAVSGGKVAVACGEGDFGKLFLWDVEKWQQGVEFRGHTAAVLGLDFARDLRLISCSGDQTVRIWKSDTGEQLQKIEGYSKPVEKVALSPDAKSLVAQMGTVTNICDPASLGRSNMQQNPEQFIMFLPGSDHRLLHGNNRKLLTIKAHATSHSTYLVIPLLGKPRLGIFTPDGQKILTVLSENKNPLVVDYRLQQESAELIGMTAPPSCLAASNANIVAAGDTEGTIALWKIP